MTTSHEAFEAHYQRSAEDPASAEMLAVWHAAWKVSTENAAKQVPGTWLDSMLTGPGAAPGIDNADARTIENLLRRIAAAIRAQTGGEG